MRSKNASIPRLNHAGTWDHRYFLGGLKGYAILEVCALLTYWKELVHAVRTYPTRIARSRRGVFPPGRVILLGRRRAAKLGSDSDIDLLVVVDDDPLPEKVTTRAGWESPPLAPTAALLGAGLLTGHSGVPVAGFATDQARLALRKPSISRARSSGRSSRRSLKGSAIRVRNESPKRANPSAITEWASSILPTCPSAASSVL